MERKIGCLPVVEGGRLKGRKEAVPISNAFDNKSRRGRLADGAFDDKEFDAAANYYEHALEVARWWPQGHYDRAMVLASGSWRLQ
jgi:hypothetical protein